MVLSIKIVVKPSRVLVKAFWVGVTVEAVDRSYETVVEDVAGDSGVFFVVVVERAAELLCVISTNELKEEDPSWRLLLRAVGPFSVDVADSSAGRLFDTAVVVDHGVDCDVVLELGCGVVDMDPPFTDKVSSLSRAFDFLAMATMAPTSAPVTSTTARKIAMKHCIVGSRRLSFERAGRYDAISTFPAMRI